MKFLVWIALHFFLTASMVRYPVFAAAVTPCTQLHEQESSDASDSEPAYRQLASDIRFRAYKLSTKAPVKILVRPRHLSSSKHVCTVKHDCYQFFTFRLLQRDNGIGCPLRN